MSYISKTGIEPGSIIKSEHILRVINALDSTDAKDIAVTGTVTATSFAGDGSSLTNVTASTAGNLSTANLKVTGSLGVTGSLNVYLQEGTPTNTSTPAGYYKATLNGNTVYIPYYT